MRPRDMSSGSRERGGSAAEAAVAEVVDEASEATNAAADFNKISL
jgi:hypothetical protein